jgi:N-methylhydantoinase A
MLVTRGFRDHPRDRALIRSRLYDVYLRRSRRRSCPVDGVRSRPSGSTRRVLEPSTSMTCDERAPAPGRRRRCDRFLAHLLNPAHERARRPSCARRFSGTWLSVSPEVAPEFREYLRGSTAAVNAAVMPIVSRTDAIESRLAAWRDRAVLCDAAERRRHDVRVGVKAARSWWSPAGGGVIAAGAVAASYGYRNVLSFDMGGTTAKVGLIQDGRFRVSTEMEVGAQAITPLGEGRGGGYPVRTPVIDLVEVGAGGGSQAWIDAGGALRVGPRSAGARPGPACLDSAGRRQPSRTRASRWRINPSFFLGAMMLDTDAARCRGPGRPNRWPDPPAAASGIEIANAHMIGAMRLVSVQRLRPARFRPRRVRSAGPPTPNPLARELGIPTVPRAAESRHASGIGCSARSAP